MYANGISACQNRLIYYNNSSNDKYNNSSNNNNNNNNNLGACQECVCASAHQCAGKTQALPSGLH